MSKFCQFEIKFQLAGSDKLETKETIAFDQKAILLASDAPETRSFLPHH
jgi:hypothetical protein